MKKTYDSKQRRGVSTGETIAATVVLSIAIVSVGRFAASVNRGLHQRELATRIGWQVQNARAEIAAWSYDEITPANIEKQLTLSKPLTEKLESPKWQASVVDVLTPLPAKRVHISLTCTYNEQTTTPGELTFWVPVPKADTKVGEPSDEA